MQPSKSGTQKNQEMKSTNVSQTAGEGTEQAQQSVDMKLPREFRKGILADVDQRFLLILLFSLIFHVFAVEYLMRHLRKQATPDYYTSLQDKFASLLVERNASPLVEQPELTERPTIPSAVPITGGATGGGAAGTGPAAVATGPAGAVALGSPETRGPTVEDVASGISGGAAARAAAMESMEASVGSVGILGILTSPTGVVSGTNMDDVLAYAVATDAELSQSLSNLDALQVSGGQGGGVGGSGGSGPLGGRVARGHRRESRSLTVTDLVGDLPPLGDAVVTEMTREERFESIGSTITKRPDVPSTPEEKARLRRKPEHVQAVIQRHNLAITDCYKSHLKLEPTLKGKVVVRFAVDPDGRVSDTEVLESTFENPEIENCIVMRMRRWNDFGYGDPTAPDEVYRQVYTFGY